MKKTFIIAIFLVLLITNTFAQTKQAPQLGENSVREVIAAMTVDEKVNLIKGTGMKMAPGGDGPVAGNVEGRVPGAAGSTFGIPHLGIPSIVLADGPAGLRIAPQREGDSKTYYATAFPVGTALASTWNTQLVESVGEAMGNEVLEYGVDVLLAPGMNIQRNPLCGRNFEYYSEDPVLTGKIAAAMTAGVQSNGVGVAIKHYAANNQETYRNSIDAIVSQRALREIYLRPFEIAVKESNPWTIMSSYNRINGVYASEDYDLLTTVLRDEWGFGGLVMTDWFAGRNYPGQVKAGNDLLMPGRQTEFKRIKEAIGNKSLSMADLDRNVERILTVILKTPAFRNYNYSDKPDLNKHAGIARGAAAEGMVLLKNEGSALPFRAGSVALLGNASYDTFVGGTGSGEVNKAYTIPLYEGLKNSGIAFDQTLTSDYLAYIEAEKKARPARATILDAIKPVDEKVVSQDKLAELAKHADIAIITIGRNSGESSDRNIETDYYLSGAELNLIKNTSAAFREQNKKTVVILNIDAVVDVAAWHNLADAILISWLPGQEAGNAIADVLKGVANPSGRLTQTLPMSYPDVPSSQSFPGTPKGKEESSVYNEGIYVGYRYYNTFDKPVAYDFGFGLSYTTFEFGEIQTPATTFAGSILVRVDTENTGKEAGKEVVQLYVSAPGKAIEKPESELKAFAKTKRLNPGEQQQISFTLKAADLASFDSARSAWVVEPGTYTLKVGSSSRNIKQVRTFTVEAEIVVGNVHDVLKPQVAFDELKK